jgi:hypothetical protein
MRVPAAEIAQIPELAYNRLGPRVACALANAFFEEGPERPNFAPGSGLAQQDLAVSPSGE